MNWKREIFKLKISCSSYIFGCDFRIFVFWGVGATHCTNASMSLWSSFYKECIFILWFNLVQNIFIANSSGIPGPFIRHEPSGYDFVSFNIGGDQFSFREYMVTWILNYYKLLQYLTLFFQIACVFGFLSKHSKDFRSNYYIQYVSYLYRQAQILVILSNKCFQAYLWPCIQFCGALAFIALFYSSLIFEESLGISGVLIMCLILIVVAGTSCSMLAMGSRTIILSTKILQNAQSWNDCRWSRKFFRSCPTIALGVGEFHKMDTQRMPTFIRFVLQRTFFLVLRTKLSLKRQNEVDIDIKF